MGSSCRSRAAAIRANRLLGIKTCPENLQEFRRRITLSLSLSAAEVSVPFVKAFHRDTRDLGWPLEAADHVALNGYFSRLFVPVQFCPGLRTHLKRWTVLHTIVLFSTNCTTVLIAVFWSKQTALIAATTRVVGITFSNDSNVLETGRLQSMTTEVNFASVTMA